MHLLKSNGTGTGNGYGHGYGDGDGYGRGHGHGHGHGDGYGYVDGHGGTEPLDERHLLLMLAVRTNPRQIPALQLRG